MWTNFIALTLITIIVVGAEYPTERGVAAETDVVLSCKQAFSRDAHLRRTFLSSTSSSDSSSDALNVINAVSGAVSLSSCGTDAASGSSLGSNAGSGSNSNCDVRNSASSSVSDTSSDTVSGNTWVQCVRRLLTAPIPLVGTHCD